MPTLKTFSSIIRPIGQMLVMYSLLQELTGYNRQSGRLSMVAPMHSVKGMASLLDFRSDILPERIP